MEDILITIAFMAKELNRKPDTVKRQLQTAGEKPVEYHGPTGMYFRSAMEEIGIVPPRGRPKINLEPIKLAPNPTKTKK